MSKQDRQGVRTPAQLEQKYNFGQVFSNAETSNAALAAQLNRMSQSMAQYMAASNGRIAELEQALAAQAEELSIVAEASGEEILLVDSAARPLRALTLYGKTTQEGAPSLAAPVDMVNAGAGGVITVTVDEQALSLAVPGGLPGIPVASGGNYTDEDGQQWICDEVDLARGVYVQRLGFIANYAGEAVTEPYMSTTGDLSEGVAVLYLLTEPTESRLDEETVEAYRALHTNKPTTAVSNDSGAGMRVEYVADTKAYIDYRCKEVTEDG